MLIDSKHLHRYYFITPNIACPQKLLALIKTAINMGVPLISLRCELLTIAEYITLATTASNYANKYGAKILVKGDFSILQNCWCQGIHLTAKQLLACYNINKKSTEQLIVASCHNIVEINKAEQLGINFITLSPVANTTSHPQQQPLGIPLAKYLTAITNLPVYWLGGQQLADLSNILAYGAYGIAGITTFTKYFTSCVK